jgi:hypothetical protein
VPRTTPSTVSSRGRRLAGNRLRVYQGHKAGWDGYGMVRRSGCIPGAPPWPGEALRSFFRCGTLQGMRALRLEHALASAFLSWLEPCLPWCRLYLDTGRHFQRRLDSAELNNMRGGQQSTGLGSLSVLLSSASSSASSPPHQSHSIRINHSNPLPCSAPFPPLGSALRPSAHTPHPSTPLHVPPHPRDDLEFDA